MPLIQQHFATVRKPTDWGHVLPALAVVLGKNGFEEQEVIGQIKDECRKRGCPEKMPLSKSKSKMVWLKGRAKHYRGRFTSTERPALKSRLGANGAAKIPAPSFHNAKAGIAAMGIKIRHDVFHDVTVVESADARAHDIAPAGRRSDRPVLLRLRDIFSDTYGFDAGENHIWARRAGVCRRLQSSCRHDRRSASRVGIRSRGLIGWPPTISPRKTAS